MDARIIQQQVLIGSSVTFFLKTGQALTGILIEISRSYVVIESLGKKATIFLEMIGAWRVEEESESQTDGLALNNGSPNTISRGPMPLGTSTLSLTTTLPQTNGNAEGESEAQIDRSALSNDSLNVISLEPSPLETSTLSLTTPFEANGNSSNSSSNTLSDEPTPIESTIPPPTIALPQANGGSVESSRLSESADSEIIRSLLAIEAKYDARIRFAQLAPDNLEFKFPSSEVEKNRHSEAHTAWQNIKNIYDYAVKVQELEPKHGRVGRFAYQLAQLAGQYPEAHTLKRQAAYASFLAGQPKNALDLWKRVAIATQTSDDWKSVAAIALQDQDDATCCYALAQYYAKALVNEKEGAWFVFISLVRKLSNYSALLATIQSRTFNKEEIGSLFEAGVYLTKAAGQEGWAERYVGRIENDPPSLELLIWIFRQFPQKPAKSYEQIAASFEAMAHPHTWYKERRPHDKARSSKEKANAAAARREPISPPRDKARSIEERAKLTLEYADLTNYQEAAAEMQRILGLRPDYPNGQALYAKWRRFAAEKKLRETGLPKGTGYFARAKCADIIEDDHDRAIKLYKLAIEHNDRAESAVKDLAMVLDELGRYQEAVTILNNYRDQAKDPQAIDGLLMTLYQKAGETDKALPLLHERAKRAPNATKRAQFLWIIANLHLSRQEIEAAERIFRQVLAEQPGNNIAKRHIAICMLKQGRLDEAEHVLNEILEQASDAQAAEMLAAAQQARSGAGVTDIDIMINTGLSDFLTEISGFTKFFLDRCDYKGVPPERIQAQEFNRIDVEKLEERAQLLGSKLPRDRSSYYLSAAKINATLEDSDPNRFYRYLCRSFASMGDAIVHDSGMLDSACDLYCEALAVYDNDHSRSRDEQDAANALIRVLYATLGMNRIPMTASTHLSIDEAIESVIVQHPDRVRVFHYIAYLIYRSRYAAARILRRLYHSNWKTAALDYLRNQDVEITKPVTSPEEFARLWNLLRRRYFENYRLLTNEFRYLTRIEIVPSVIENCISQIGSIGLLFFELDGERARELKRVLELTLEMCSQSAFEERERFCLQADSRCRELMHEIETSPTKFSIEQLFPVLQSLQQKLSSWLEELYQSSTPSLSLRLAIESYSPNHERRIEVQIAIENQSGRSPAEGLELEVAQENDQVYSLLKSDFRLNGSLRGGDQEIIVIPLQLTSQALSAEAFSMTVHVRYRTRSEKEPSQVIENFSIQLTTEFEDFDNPYHAYAKGGVVHERGMFYGRDGMIESIVNTLTTNSTSKSIVLYGQMRSGKSSILYHLKESLQQNPDLLVLYIENIGTVLDEQSRMPLLYQILWSILRQLQRSIRRREYQGHSKLELGFPSDQEFYNHPAPLTYFSDIFEDFKDATSRSEGWQNVRVVLLIDEFSYIYGYIIKGILSEDFMLNWKALLQRNYFSAVLAGQDVMPKFIKRYPNAWGTTEDRQVGYLNEEDAGALIDEPIRVGGKSGESRYREKAIERIIELTAGNPFYIQIICNRLVEHMRTTRQKLATKANVERIRDALIRGLDALKISDFDNLISSGDTSPDAISEADAKEVLEVVARNTRQVSTCARNEIVCNTERPIAAILDDLVTRNVLECERGSYYRIRVGLFKEWLIENS